MVRRINNVTCYTLGRKITRCYWMTVVDLLVKLAFVVRLFSENGSAGIRLVN